MTLLTHCFRDLHRTEFPPMNDCVEVQDRPLLPVYDGAHVQADVLKSSHGAFFHRMQVGELIVDQNRLHAALEGALAGREQRLQEVS